jgi:hypothetical protein
MARLQLDEGDGLHISRIVEGSLHGVVLQVMGLGVVGLTTLTN